MESAAIGDPIVVCYFVFIENYKITKIENMRYSTNLLRHVQARFGHFLFRTNEKLPCDNVDAMSGSIARGTTKQTVVSFFFAGLDIFARVAIIRLRMSALPVRDACGLDSPYKGPIKALLGPIIGPLRTSKLKL